MYHLEFNSSATHDVCRFFHTKAHSVDGVSCVTRISHGLFSANDIGCMLSYTLRFYILNYSVCFWGFNVRHVECLLAQTHQCPWYPPRVGGGLFRGRIKFQYFSQNAVADPSLLLWAHIRLSSRARHFAATSIKPRPPLLLSL
jgi:hypothetical protein